jgi:hypothetical protein
MEYLGPSKKVCYRPLSFSSYLLCIHQSISISTGTLDADDWTRIAPDARSCHADDAEVVDDAARRCLPDVPGPVAWDGFAEWYPLTDRSVFNDE